MRPVVISSILDMHLDGVECTELSGGFRNLERGVQPLACKAHPKILGVATPTSSHVNVWTEYLEATIGLVKRLEISKELIHECVTVPGCCCCILLLYNHLMDSCSYLRKNTHRQRGVHLHPLNPPLELNGCSSWTLFRKTRKLLTGKDVCAIH